MLSAVNLLAVILCGVICPAHGAVTFFVKPDGELHNADPARKAAFVAATTRPLTEFDFAEFGHAYIYEPSPLMAGPVRVRPSLLNAQGQPAADLSVNGNRLVETYISIPTIPGILGPAALISRTFAGSGDVAGVAMEFTFSEPVEAFGAWIIDDILLPNRFVLKVTEASGATSTSEPLESGNGNTLAVEGFIGAVSTVGITRVVIEQQTLAGNPTNADLFYVDHVLVGGRYPPEICDNGIDDNDDGAADCMDTECDPHPHC